MNFNDHVKENRLVLSKIRVNISKLISFLQENKSITHLSLDTCNIGKEGAEALANSENLKNLTTLDLSWNLIGKEGAEALANSENLKNLTTLDLSWNSIGKGAEALANSENLKNLTTLNLRGNFIGKEGAEALANSENLKNLTMLDLRENFIGKEGAEALANSENLKNLKFLSINIGDKVYHGNKVDLLQEIENGQGFAKAMKIGSVCGVIAALVVGIGCSTAGIVLPILTIIGIVVAAALVVGIVAGSITYSVSKPSDKLNEPGLEVANQQIPEKGC
ncbi:hypothetical protein [Wolbachia endosymbiont of Rhagoletis cingulata]|uniref:hypothetical protein n=1 Tax=Wolbachia endosymbiont of Rhagoletis cingulata TaxID=1220542 RepID=UPI003AF36C84